LTKTILFLKKIRFILYRIYNKENELDEDDQQRKHSTNRIVDTFKFREHGHRWSKV